MTLARLSISEAGSRLRAGSLTSVELTRAHLTLVRQLDPAYRAFVAVMENTALDEAAAADREFAAGVDRGPLQGIPVGIKDLIDTAGVTTSYGSRVFEGHVPAGDAAVARRLRDAGAVILGKLATYEFALVGPSFDLPAPPATNPWNVARITGGSSSGCAAAVAGGLLRTSIGTDTGGSVRSPAGYCGVVGLKPSLGRVGKDGVFPLSRTLDHVGTVSASVAEAALTLDVIADPGGDGARAASQLDRDIAGLRIAYARDWFASDPGVMPQMVRVMDAAASQLSLLGARIEEVSLPDYAVFEASASVILHAEALAAHSAPLRERSADYGRLAFQSLMSGVCLSEADVELARSVRSTLTEALQDRVFNRFDALLTANTLATAPAFSSFDGKRAVWTPMRTIPFNLTGHPALAVPAGFIGGLPAGMQIVGRPFGEATICRIGHAFEQATDHSTERPPAPMGGSYAQASF